MKEREEALGLEELSLEEVVFFEGGFGGRFWWLFAAGRKEVGSRGCLL